MNEITLKLAQQAGWDISEIMKIQNAAKMQKFADLIVQECIASIQGVDGDTAEATHAQVQAENAVRDMVRS